MSMFKDEVTGNRTWSFWTLLSLLIGGLFIAAWWVIKFFFFTTTDVVKDTL